MYPLMRYGRSDERGYLSFRVDAHLMRCEVRSVLDPNDPASGIRSAARFVVEASRPGARRA
jgi:alkaline phosphatase D